MTKNVEIYKRARIMGARNRQEFTLLPLIIAYIIVKICDAQAFVYLNPK